jgi:TolB-like protein
MSSAGNTPAAPRPSVFISYASEDRAAARALRDALLATGLEVWYDENELAGGDAWDQKIRRQIRDCDYFMPVISVTTERRKEGYFRREWRLAAERTMDMADDVLFLLPISIDGTSESGARVPDRFLAVQWLRAPGGQRTPALDALAQRLLAGEHTIAPRPPPLVTRPPIPLAAPPPPPASDTAKAEGHPPPPSMPPFPHAPEKASHWFKFAAEVVWWVITAAWLLFGRLPRWLRIILAIWLVFTLITCERDTERKPRHPPSESKEIRHAAKIAAEHLAKAKEAQGEPKDWGKLGEELGRRIGDIVDQATVMGKPLIVVPFTGGPGSGTETEFAQAVISSCFGQIVAARQNDAAVSRVMPTNNTDDAWSALGKQLEAGFVLGARVSKTDGTSILAVRLIQTESGTVTWSEDFSITGNDPKEVGAKIATAVLPLLPPKK